MPSHTDLDKTFLRWKFVIYANISDTVNVSHCMTKIARNWKE